MRADAKKNINKIFSSNEININKQNGTYPIAHIEINRGTLLSAIGQAAQRLPVVSGALGMDWYAVLTSDVVAAILALTASDVELFHFRVEFHHRMI